MLQETDKELLTTVTEDESASLNVVKETTKKVIYNWICMIYI